MLQHWIWLATRPSLSDRTKVELLEHFGDAQAVYFAQKQEYSAIASLTAQGMTSLDDKDLTKAKEILDECVDKEIQIMTFRDAAYPMKLKNIPDPPVVLYYKGRLPDLDGRPSIGVVGTRKASAYGLLAAKRLGYQIAACGGIVVSGLAEGIDGKSMEGALSAGMSVVGVLGCGADIVYPACNRWLFRDTERYGCILTEYPPGSPPYGYHFPHRNRIISGLSDGVLVIEAPKNSGALITARQGGDQGRDVFAVPGNIDSPTSVGCNQLLHDGALAVASGWDVVGEYEGRYPGMVRRNQDGKQLRLYPDEMEPPRRRALKVAQKPKTMTKKSAEAEPLEKKVIDNSPNESYIDLTKTDPSLTADEQVIVELLSHGQMQLDDMIDGSGLPAGQVLASLTLLEVKGLVRRLPGRMICLAKGK